MADIKLTAPQETMLSNIKEHFPMAEFSREEYKEKTGASRLPSTQTLNKLVEYEKLIKVNDKYRLIAAGADLTIKTFAVEDKKTTTDSVSMLFKVRSVIRTNYDRIESWINNSTSYATEPDSQKGIYRIVEKSTGKVLYIGQTGGKGHGKATFNSRWKEHSDSLVKGNHHCEKLQHYFNTVANKNLDNLLFEIQEELPSDPILIDNRERFWINHYKPTLLNTKFPSLVPHTLSEKCMTSDVRAKTLKGLEEIARQTAAAIHNYLYAAVKLSDQDKATLIAGIVIALNKKTFLENYRTFSDGDEFVEQFDSAIKHSISQYKGLRSGQDAIYATFDFVKHNDNFKKTITGKVYEKQSDGTIEEVEKTFIALQFLTEIIEESICKIAKDYPDYDVMGDFYNEFAKYSGADQQSLGIVLTPHHVADFMSDLLDIQENDVILDICCGTGALPITAHQYSSNKIIGIEYQARMTALCLANMIMRGYNAILYQGDSYSEQLLTSVKELKPNKMIINPPYAQDGYPELGFVKKGLDQLVEGGLGVAIVPMSCAIKTDTLTKKMRKELLDQHELIATFSMPDQLFYPIGVVTIVMLFRAHACENDMTFFGYLKDDGFEINRTNGRQDAQGKWQGIKKEMIDLYQHFEAKPGKSAIAYVTSDNEWCCEAYMQTDYGIITPEMFKKELKKMAIFNLKMEDI